MPVPRVLQCGEHVLVDGPAQVDAGDIGPQCGVQRRNGEGGGRVEGPAGGLAGGFAASVAGDVTGHGGALPVGDWSAANVVLVGDIVNDIDLAYRYPVSVSGPSAWLRGIAACRGASSCFPHLRAS